MPQRASTPSATCRLWLGTIVASLLVVVGLNVGTAPTSSSLQVSAATEQQQASPIAVLAEDLTYTRGRVVPRTLDVIGPENAHDLPVVVLFHGDPPNRKDMEPLARFIAGQGVVVFNVSTSHFSLANAPITDWYQDASCAVVYAVARARDYGGNPEKLVLAGYSGGAGIAMAVGMNPTLVAGDCVEAPARFPRSSAVVSIAGDYYNREFIDDLRGGRAVDQDFWVDAFRGDEATMDRYLKLLDVEMLMRQKLARPVEVTLVGGMPIHDNTAPLSRWFSFVISAGLGGYDVSMELVSLSNHRSFVTPGTRAFLASGNAIADAALRLN